MVSVGEVTESRGMSSESEASRDEDNMLTALSNDKADEVIDLSSASKYVIVTGLCHTVVGSLPVW